MDWIALSLLSALALSAYTVLQKYAFQRHISNILAFGMLGAVLHLLIAVVILVVAPIPISWGALPVIAVVGAGLLHAVYTLLIYQVVQREDEVSRVVSVVDTYPVFVGILAILFLGEALTLAKWLAMVLVIGGAVLASWHQALPGSQIRLDRSFVLLLAASFGIAIYSVVIKYALAHLPIWHVYALSSVGSAPMYALAVQHFHAWLEVRLATRRAGALATTGIANGMLFLAFISGFLAFSLGPVSLSSAIMASRPLIVLAYATLISVFVSRVLPERTSRDALMTKGTAATLVAGGVVAMVFL